MLSDFRKENPCGGLNELFDCISRICGCSLRPVILMIDEVDSASNNQVFIDFLAQLRAYYLKRDKMPTFHSVILAGVYNIKNLKLKLRLSRSINITALGISPHPLSSICFSRQNRLPGCCKHMKRIIIQEWTYRQWQRRFMHTRLGIQFLYQQYANTLMKNSPQTRRLTASSHFGPSRSRSGCQKDPV